METTMTREMAMSAVRGTGMRPWRGANTAHAGTFRSDQGRTVPFGGLNAADLKVTYVGRTGDANAPITGVVCPHLEAPPV